EEQLFKAEELDQAGNLVESIAEYTQALALQPKLVQALHGRGSLHARLKHWDDAAADFARALELVPGIPDPWSYDQGAFDHLAQWDEVFERVARLRPKDARLWMARAQRLGSQGRWQEAAKAAAKAVEFAPDEHISWYDYAPLCLYLGDVEEYRRSCREMLARFGQSENPQIAERVAKDCSLAA